MEKKRPFLQVPVQLSVTGIGGRILRLGQPVLPRRAVVFFPEQAVKVAHVVIADLKGDIADGHVRGPQQKAGLREPLFLHQIGVILPGFPLDFPGKGAEILVQPFAQLPQAAVPVMVLDIAERLHHRFLLRVAADQAVRVIEQLQKKQPHGQLVDLPFVRRVVDERPDQVFHQILDGRYVRDLKMKVSRRPAAVFQAVHQETAQRRLLVPHHPERAVEKFRKDDEVDGNVFSAGGQDLLPGAGAQEKQLSLPEKDLLPVDNVGGLSRAHVNDLYVIVRMLRKTDETGVGAHGNQPAGFQQLPAVDNIRAFIHVEAAVDGARAVQKPLLLRRDRQKLFENFLSYHTPASLPLPPCVCFLHYNTKRRKYQVKGSPHAVRKAHRPGGTGGCARNPSGIGQNKKPSERMAEGEKNPNTVCTV